MQVLNHRGSGRLPYQIDHYTFYLDQLFGQLLTAYRILEGIRHPSDVHPNSRDESNRLLRINSRRYRLLQLSLSRNLRLK